MRTRTRNRWDGPQKPGNPRKELLIAVPCLVGGVLLATSRALPDPLWNIVLGWFLGCAGVMGIVRATTAWLDAERSKRETVSDDDIASFD